MLGLCISDCSPSVTGIGKLVARLGCGGPRAHRGRFRTLVCEAQRRRRSNAPLRPRSLAARYWCSTRCSARQLSPGRSGRKTMKMTELAERVSRNVGPSSAYALSSLLTAACESRRMDLGWRSLLPTSTAARVRLGLSAQRRVAGCTCASERVPNFLKRSHSFSCSAPPRSRSRTPPATRLSGNALARPRNPNTNGP